MSQTTGRISPTGTVAAFLNGRACSDTLLYVLNRAFGQPLLEEERAAMPFAGGLMQHGYQCGMIWGATLAAGAQAYRLFGGGPHAEARAIAAAQRLVESFRALNSATDCFEITEINGASSAMQVMTYFLLKGGTVRCFRRAARYAPIAFKEINAALSGQQVETSPAPVSCSAMLAQRMGVSEMHVVMAAGLAGGIGLSGGACGALGAAIWILGMKSLREGAAKVSFKAPRALQIIESFLKCTDYQFECSTIVGRKFDGVGDHADYVCKGGCSKIIEAMAAK